MRGGGGSDGGGGSGGGGGGGGGGLRWSGARRRHAGSSSGVGSWNNRAAGHSEVPLGSSALQRYLPTWTSLAAEAVWLRGSRKGGNDIGAIDDSRGTGSGRGSKSTANDSTNSSRSRTAAAGAFQSLTASESSWEGEEGWGGHRGKGLRSCRRRAGETTSFPAPKDFSQQAEGAKEDTVAPDRPGGAGGSVAGGRGWGRGRAVPPPSLDPDVERKLMDWLRLRIGRCVSVEAIQEARSVCVYGDITEVAGCAGKSSVLPYTLDANNGRR